MLLIHGDDDRNVPFTETVSLVAALRRQGVEFEQLVFPDEVHDFLLHADWLRAYAATADSSGGAGQVDPAHLPPPPSGFRRASTPVSGRRRASGRLRGGLDHLAPCGDIGLLRRVAGPVVVGVQVEGGQGVGDDAAQREGVVVAPLEEVL